MAALQKSQTLSDDFFRRTPSHRRDSLMLKRSSAALTCLAVAVACLTSAADDQPDSTQALIGRIKKVGREGKNNAEAAKAWKQLVARGPAALPAILDGMDDDDPTSSNWLRPAFEAVAEK